MNDLALFSIIFYTFATLLLMVKDDIIKNNIVTI